MRALLLLALSWFAALPAQAQEIVVTFGGDVNFAQSRATPSADRVTKGATYSLGHTTDFLGGEFTGDINFVNVETVVSTRDGSRLGKTFVFRSHPESFRHLMALGVNAFSLANNHAYDHGWQGLSDTLAFFEGEDRPDRPLLFAGIGRGSEAFAPQVTDLGGIRVAFSAIGIGAQAYGAGGERPGMAIWGNDAHWEAVLKGLRDTEADLKILSIHYGTENQIALNYGQRDQYRRAIEEAGVNLVIGHHPHIVRAVEAEPEAGRAIFYSLGNLLFVGGAVRDGLPVGQDYGLFGKAYFHMTPDGPRLSALEALPLRNVHLSPEPMTPSRLRATLDHLSGISRQAAGAQGVAFTPLGPDADRGAACYGGPYGPAARALCCRLSWSMECDLPDLM
ncbi:CapA family protein [Roseisalinus antarcticus]|uniref:Capsule biosynthesis protein CapA n=1 Tax=Roseisalinus antarcticus TaxID=254357 RepID=A0A1Y5RIK4_9RHOB|nr:CapA family protein [Roseisalinus antarcticus]SLN18405.1 Capsule biosynthesis protein CapA [Roseisalinus antarcticus]